MALLFSPEIEGVLGLPTVTPAATPTLSEWGMILLLSGLLGLLGVVQVRRQPQAPR